MAQSRPGSVPVATTLAHSPNGEQIVASMAAGREWWRLHAGDVSPWIRGLPVAVRTDKYNRLGWLGRPWDGVSDIPIGEAPWDGESDTNRAEPLVEDMGNWDSTAVKGPEVTRLISELRRLLAARPLPGVAIPDHRDVRSVLAGEEGDVSEPTTGMLVVDFDLGGFTVPIGMEDWQLREDTWTPVERVAELMLERLQHAVRNRGELLARDLRMRGAFERILAEFGGGAAPLWLRMEPLRFDQDASDLTHLPYVALAVTLDLHQVWAPSGIERVRSPRKLRKRYTGFAAQHRRDVERLLTMKSSNSLGWISDVALAFIEQGGRNPADVMREVRDAGLNDKRLEHYGCEGYFGALFCHHGILTPFFTFEKGRYTDGKLSIDGTYPETLAQAAPGRPLAQIVEHPAFALADVTIDHVERSETRLDLFHTPRLFTVEEAERKWLDARVSASVSNLAVDHCQFD